MTDTARAGSEPGSTAGPALPPLDGYPGPSVGGLTPAAAVVLVVVVTFVAGLLSAATGHGFGFGFNVIYLAVVLYVSLRIYTSDRFTAVVAPPLAYAFTLLIAGRFDTTDDGHTIKLLVENMFLNLSLNAPWLVGTTLAAIVIAIVRGRRAIVHGRAR